ncbi:MAG TPA: extracellular solute-binding protein, partial [Actinomycetota bacterium]|nr:extracellular solute-binding protein [Actinomycetota bacterium]
MRTVARGAGTAAVLPILARCAPEAVEVGAGPSGPRTLRVANLPLALPVETGVGDEERRPVLDLFTQETGIPVDHREVVGDPSGFVRSLLPRLQAGEPVGWDVVVLPLGPILVRLLADGFLLALPAERPHFDANAAGFVRDPPYDPGSGHTMAWRGDVTGLASNPGLAGRPATELAQLFDPAMAGKVGMPADPYELGNIGLLAAGAEPASSGPEQWERAAAVLRRQRDGGIVRGYYGRREAIEALAAGDVALAVARSSDVFQANPGNDPQGIRFAYPAEGALLWIDAMWVPRGAEHVAEAVRFMDFVYRPDVAAMVASAGGWLSPVPSS